MACHRRPTFRLSYTQLKSNATCLKTPTYKFELMPRLADRSVVIKPVDPIYIPAGERWDTLYQYTFVDFRFY